MSGDVGVVRALVDARADVDARARYTPPGLLESFVSVFVSAIFVGLIDIEDMLKVDLADMHGWSPVQFAAAAGHTEVVDALKEISSPSE